MTTVNTNNNKKRFIIGLVGFIGSGKDTAADYLVENYQFHRESFAGSLKDVVCAVFGWDREMIEGRTAESRKWRDRVDTWWADRLGIPHLTPRWALQHWGTELCRGHFHDDIWIASLENKLQKAPGNIVITDCRFPNEIKSIINAGGKVYRVRRGADPEWYGLAEKANKGDRVSKEMFEEYNIHSSETAWIGTEFNGVIYNNGTLDELFTQVESTIRGPVLSRPVSTVDVAYEEAVDNWHKLS